MRIRTLCAVTLTGPVIPPRTEVTVPAGFERRAQRLIDNGSAELLDRIQASADGADGLSGKAAGADSSAPVATPNSTTDAQTETPDGDDTAHTGGPDDGAGSTDNPESAAAPQPSAPAVAPRAKAKRKAASKASSKAK